MSYRSVPIDGPVVGATPLVTESLADSIRSLEPLVLSLLVLAVVGSSSVGGGWFAGSVARRVHVFDACSPHTMR